MLSKSDTPFRDSAIALSNSFWVMRLFVTRRSNLVGFFFEILRRLKKAMPSAFAISATDSSSFLVNRTPLFLLRSWKTPIKYLLSATIG